MIKAIFSLLTMLPEIISLLKVWQEHIDQDQRDRKIKDDMKVIHEAFLKKDAEALNRLFSGK